jgi:hypothetical protein
MNAHEKGTSRASPFFILLPLNFNKRDALVYFICVCVKLRIYDLYFRPDILISDSREKWLHIDQSESIHKEMKAVLLPLPCLSVKFCTWFRVNLRRLTSITHLRVKKNIILVQYILFEIKDHSIEFYGSRNVSCVEFIVWASMQHVIFFFAFVTFPVWRSPVLRVVDSFFFSFVLCLNRWQVRR